MKNKNIYFKVLLVFGVSILGLILSFAGFYTYWNTALPEQTCASCHEIQSSVHSLSQSSHRNLACKACHGTALSNGFHSIREKAMMVVNHAREERVEDIRMNETQMLEVMGKCKECHASEFANWKSGGHSATYKDIFLDKNHNQTEQLNFDCLRCHGMFYEGNTNDLVEPIDTEGPWTLKDSEKADLPVISCLACHQIHTKGEISKSPDFSVPKDIFYTRNMKAKSVAFYNRHEKLHFDLAELPNPVILNGIDTVKTPKDQSYRLCVQCHAPSVWHQAGSSDDRTPTGVHEGISCLACHLPHSNDARSSCKSCHPAISNCGLDVTTMNTTYSNAKSLNNIHSVSCADCHLGDIRSDSKLRKVRNIK